MCNVHRAKSLARSIGVILLDWEIQDDREAILEIVVYQLAFLENRLTKADFSWTEGWENGDGHMLFCMAEALQNCITTYLEMTGDSSGLDDQGEDLRPVPRMFETLGGPLSEWNKSGRIPFLSYGPTPGSMLS